MKKILLLLAIILTGMLLLAACQASPAGEVPAGAVAGKAESGGAAFTNLTPKELKALYDKKDFILVDVHVPVQEKLPRTDLFIPYTDIRENLDKLPADKNSRIVLYCQSGHMSGIAANELVQLGYTNVLNLAGGLAAWEQAGYSVER